MKPKPGDIQHILWNCGCETWWRWSKIPRGILKPVDEHVDEDNCKRADIGPLEKLIEELIKYAD